MNTYRQTDRQPDRRLSIFDVVILFSSATMWQRVTVLMTAWQRKYQQISRSGMLSRPVFYFLLFWFFFCFSSLRQQM